MSLLFPPTHEKGRGVDQPEGGEETSPPFGASGESSQPLPCQTSTYLVGFSTMT